MTVKQRTHALLKHFAPVATGPGVSVVESNEPLLSISSGATAVPVFIGTFRTLEGVLLGPEECLEVQSLFDFNRRFGSSQSIDVKVAVVEESKTDPFIEVTVAMALGSLSLQAYFDNGGSRCFVLPILPGVDADLMAVASAIARQPQISLICSTERSVIDGVVTLDPVYSALGDLLSKTGAPFLIADSPDGVQRPTTVAQRTAVYYPALESTYSARPADQHIHLDTGETLDQIKASNRDLYKIINAQVDETLATQVPVVHLKASPLVTAVYCKTDRERGVWKAPAGVALNSVRGVQGTVSASVQMKLMQNRINALKAFPGEGVKVWGTRTMTLPQTPLWLHVNVSRLFDAASRDIVQAMQFAVFLPNNAVTWHAVGGAIEGYLNKLWRDGGLNGRTPAEAYYVQIGAGISMTPEQLAAGLLIVHVGMAVLRPLEFIEVAYSQQLITG